MLIIGVWEPINQARARFIPRPFILVRPDDLRSNFLNSLKAQRCFLGLSFMPIPPFTLQLNILYENPKFLLILVVYFGKFNAMPIDLSSRSDLSTCLRFEKLYQIRVDEHHIWCLPEKFKNGLQKHLIPDPLKFWNE